MSFARYPSLLDRVVLITGGATGIGADMVRAFADQGAKVAFLDLLDDAAAALVAELSGRRHVRVYHHCDLVDTGALRSSIAAIGEALGPIAVLVNNAANDQRQPIAEVTPESWDASQAISLRPQFFAAQAVHPQMRALGYGSIISLSSIAWRFGADQMVPYATAKAAVIGLTGALARAFGPDNVRVNALEPGAVMTERQRRLWYPDDAQVQAIVERQVLRRVLLSEEIARAALFLAADDSRMITKQAITVDAGIR